MSESDTTVRVATAAVLATRAAYGAALLVAPAKVAGNRWLGAGAAQPAADVALRGLGAREVALHGAALGALFTGRDVRPWLVASVFGDLADIASTARARDGLPTGSAPATAVVAGVSAALSAGLALVVSRSGNAS